MRKRWSVVIVGESGLAASHRAEVGRCRSEAAARRLAEIETERLVAARGGGSYGYRVVLEHDGQEVSLTPETPPPTSAIALSGSLNGSNGVGGAGPAASEPAAPERRAYPPIPDPPPGPVPEEILQRWARERPARDP